LTRCFEINARQPNFFNQRSGQSHLHDNEKSISLVILSWRLTDGYFVTTYAGRKAPVEHFTRAAPRNFHPVAPHPVTAHRNQGPNGLHPSS